MTQQCAMDHRPKKVPFARKLKNLLKSEWAFMKAHTLAQTYNHILLRIYSRRRPIRVPYYPQTITLGVGNRCVHRCRICFWHSKESGDWHHGYNEMLSYEDFLRIADFFVKKRLAHMHFCAAGEPFLNKDIFRMFQYARSKKMSISVLSNGSRVITPLLEEIAHAGLSYFSTDLDSGDPEQFQAMRIGAKYDTVTRNIRRLADIKKRDNLDFNIHVWCIAMRSNVHTFESLIRTCKEIGADELAFSYLIPLGLNEITSEENVIKRTDTDLIAEIDRCMALAKDIGLNIVLPPQFPSNSPVVQNCDTLWTKLMIGMPTPDVPREQWWDKASAHCQLSMYGPAQSFGNIFDRPFDEVWNGPEIQEMRRMQLTDCHHLCRICPSQ